VEEVASQSVHVARRPESDKTEFVLLLLQLLSRLALQLLPQVPDVLLNAARQVIEPFSEISQLLAHFSLLSLRRTQCKTDEKKDI
jgi:hypothetical protein